MSRAGVTTADCKQHIADSVRNQADVWPHLDRACEGFAKRSFAEKPASWREVVRREEPGRGWVRDFTLAHADFERDVLARVFTDAADAEIIELVVGYVWEPADFYFVIEDYGEDAGGWLATITRRDRFDSTGYTSDQSEADGVLPEGFYRAMESTYEFEMGPEEARAALTAAGFVRKDDLFAALEAARKAKEA